MTLITFGAIVVIAVAAVLIVAMFLGNRYEARSGMSEEERVKEDNLARSLTLARERGEVTNDDIEKLLGVSDATAERYLDLLESRGHLIQIGKTGKGVRYKVKVL